MSHNFFKKTIFQFLNRSVYFQQTGRFLGVFFSSFLILVGMMACTKTEIIDGGGTGAVDGRVSVVYSGPSELSYCTVPTTHTYSPSYTITGTATFQARQVVSNVGLGNAGTAKPIRYAEVRVTDSSGSVVQCAETDVNGDFSFSLPQTGSTYTIAVNARANNSHLKISVLDQPEKNGVYALKTTVVANGNKSVGTINAGVTGEILGAPFNMYDQILDANEYLRTEVGSCPFTGCTQFTVAPKVSVYWTKGFNPGSYSGSGATSFYLPGYSRLFILGGINGDTDNEDTDHFDNSVILHEYTHFLEDTMADSDSPGGSHSGNNIIDPRLAWSEGVADFFQAAVRNSPTYIDTVGNISGSTGIIFNVDLESYNSCPEKQPGCDMARESGEANFREFAITRFLWDVVDDTSSETENSETDNISGHFDEIWAGFTSPNGFNDPNLVFKHLGLLNHVQAQVLSGASDWSQLLQMHGLVDDTGSYYLKEYGYYVDNVGSCGPQNFSITPDSTYNYCHYDSGLGDYTCANEPAQDYLSNSDFFHYKHSGGTLSLTLNYTTASGTEADLDLIVYNTSARIFSSDDAVASSMNSPNNATGDVETESVSKSLPAGDYLIQVYAYDGIGSATTYELKVGGTNLCPTSLP